MVKVNSFLCLLAVVSTATAAATQSKISPSLHQALGNKASINILVTMQETTGAALNKVTSQFAGATRAQKSQAVYDELTALAERSQMKVMNMLKTRAATPGSEIEIKSFWITNQVYIKNADWDLIQDLAAIDDVKLIREERTFQVLEPMDNADSYKRQPGQQRAEWGIEKILAAEAIAALGTNGRGAVVGILDSGVHPTHQDLRGNFRGGNHSWYHPYAPTPEPFDDHGHGTHCIGTVVGGGGIGVAPGASWIACKGIGADSSATDAGLIDCGQFFACPHDYLGSNPDCSQSPDVVSNSWGFSIPIFGRDWYDDVIRAHHAAEIIPIFAAGNEYQMFGCSSVRNPADSTEELIVVGATTIDDSIATFSSRGPNRFGNPQLPHISAPGVSIHSASNVSDDEYRVTSGTSMATPHVAGLVALLRAANPNVSYSRVKNILQNTADRDLVLTGEVCGGVSDNVFPNYQFGYGRINALRAAIALRNSKL